ncbi:Epoxide hydrolase 1 [Sesbania bispinosa]|nr:Epoxide hydrolase 1 [Sesbania bispinosa]
MANRLHTEKGDGVQRLRRLKQGGGVRWWGADERCTTPPLTGRRENGETSSRELASVHTRKESRRWVPCCCACRKGERSDLVAVILGYGKGAEMGLRRRGGHGVRDESKTTVTHTGQNNTKGGGHGGEAAAMEERGRRGSDLTNEK